MAALRPNPFITSTADQRIAVIQWTAGKKAVRENPTLLVSGLIATATIAFVCFRTGTFNKLGTASTAVLGLATTALVTYKKVIAPAFRKEPVASQLEQEKLFKQYEDEPSLLKARLTDLTAKLFPAPKSTSGSPAPALAEVSLQFNDANGRPEIKLHSTDFKLFPDALSPNSTTEGPNLRYAKAVIGDDLLWLDSEADAPSRGSYVQGNTKPVGSLRILSVGYDEFYAAKISLVAKFIIMANPFIHSGKLASPAKSSSDSTKDHGASSLENQTSLSVHQAVQTCFSNSSDTGWAAQRSITDLATFLTQTKSPITWYDSNGQLIKASQAP